MRNTYLDRPWPKVCHVLSLTNGYRSILVISAFARTNGHKNQLLQLVTMSRLAVSDSSQASRSFLVREMPRLYDFCMAAMETSA
jgi:hypothetical protein